MNFYIEAPSYLRYINFKPVHLEVLCSRNLRRHPGFVRTYRRYKHYYFGANMKKLRILPGAAGVIALTAAIGFIDGERKIETEGFSRDKITLVSARTDVAAADVASGKRLVIKPGNFAYLVEIRRGEVSSGILIDAVTGQVLLS